MDFFLSALGVNLISSYEVVDNSLNIRTLKEIIKKKFTDKFGCNKISKNSSPRNSPLSTFSVLRIFGSPVELARAKYLTKLSSK